MGFTSRNGLQYVGQVQTSFAITLDEEIGKPFLLLVNDSATDSDSIGIVEPSGKANTIPVWVAKKYAHVVNYRARSLVDSKKVRALAYRSQPGGSFFT